MRKIYLGEKNVLLSYKEEGIIEEAIVENKVWFDGIFGSIIPETTLFWYLRSLFRFAVEAFHCLQCFERIRALVSTLV